MKFTKLAPNEQRHLLDWDHPSVRTRYPNPTIPAGTKKIFTCNWDAWPFTRGDLGIDDRIWVLETYKYKGIKRKRAPRGVNYEDS